MWWSATCCRAVIILLNRHTLGIFHSVRCKPYQAGTDAMPFVAPHAFEPRCWSDSVHPCAGMCLGMHLSLPSFLHSHCFPQHTSDHQAMILSHTHAHRRRPGAMSLGSVRWCRWCGSSCRRWVGVLGSTALYCTVLSRIVVYYTALSAPDCCAVLC